MFDWHFYVYFESTTKDSEESHIFYISNTHDTPAPDSHAQTVYKYNKYNFAYYMCPYSLLF